jgi:hypothetical protein
MISVPIVWLFLIGAISFQKWWNEKKFGTSQRVVALSSLGLMAIDLWSNLKIWRPSEIEQYFQPVNLDIVGSSIANHADPDYFLVLSIGLGITLVTSIFLIAIAWREVRSKHSSS